MHPVFYITLVYFLIGALGVARVASMRKGPHWVKFLVYFLLVHAVLLLILAPGPYFLWFSVLLCLIGAYEMGKVFPFMQESWLSFLPYIGVYLIVALCFLCFAYTCSLQWKLYTYLLVFCFDGFSQLSGQLIGKTAFTRISPGKTLEGLAGGLLITLCTAMLFPGLPVEGAERLFTSLLIIAAAFAGDLLASAYKRRCGVKDFSRLLPGHGGVLDRFDSFLLAGALAYLIELFRL